MIFMWLAHLDYRAEQQRRYDILQDSLHTQMARADSLDSHLARRSNRVVELKRRINHHICEL